MDPSDPRQRALFFEVHRGLPREAPGDPVSTGRALALAQPLPAAPRVLDVGCGPGAQTLDLAALMPRAEIVAADLHVPYLTELRRRAAAAGREQRISPVRADMAALPFSNAAFDLIWCEGAAYIMGVPAALAAWTPLLVPGGVLAVTDAVWLRADVPAEVRAFWRDYPGMTDLQGCRRHVADAGLELIGDFVLPDRAWWDGYYAPMRARLGELRKRHAGDAVAMSVLDECEQEIALFERHSDCYAYAFLVMRAR
ncbi:MAG: class I SAM-dependent methyltransferase [Pseudomonadales bacterium]